MFKNKKPIYLGVFSVIAILFIASISLNIYLYQQYNLWRSAALPLVRIYTEGGINSDISIAETLMEKGPDRTKKLLSSILYWKIFDWNEKTKLDKNLFSCGDLNTIFKEKKEILKWLDITMIDCSSQEHAIR